MNVLWTKEKLHKIFSKESVTVHAHASGDGGPALGRCCRFCGGDNSLRQFADTCVWEGVEERYDQLLFECFGVRVSPSDCMICEWCVRQLRTTQRFKALVHAAFDKPLSEGSSKRSIKPIIPGNESQLREITIIDPHKRTQLKIRAPTEQAFKKRDIRNKTNTPVNLQRAILACSVCGQRYPMLVPTEEADRQCSKFVCSRCKKNGEKSGICRKCNVVMPSNMVRDHLALHVKADLRGKSRLRQQTMPLQVKQTETVLRSQYLPKHEGNQRVKRAQNVQNLTRTVHEDSLNLTCAMCGKDFRNSQLLHKHLKEHPEEALYQCRNCKTVFKSKRSLQTHSKTHKNTECFS